jgi:membrane-bound lytic murein transglycosylase B
MRFLFTTIITILFSVCVATWMPVFAQTKSLSEAIERRQKELESDLQKIEKEIEIQQKFLDEKRTERVSLERDVSILNAEIKKSQLAIQGRTHTISKLGSEIGNKQKIIQELTKRMERQKASLAQLIRETNAIGDYSLVEVVLSKENISDFFEDLDSFDSITISLQNSFREIEETKAETQEEKLSLEESQKREIDLKYIQEIEKQKVEAQEKEKQYVLGVTKGQESVYQNIVEERKREAARIRAELFALRDAEGIQFGEALEYAKEAERLTGVRAAFLLGILKQESNIGQNVGSCVITNLTTGETKSVNSGTIFANGIHPSRDLPVLQKILKDLGRDPLSTKVSCPLSVGYGGAMGPAQFIPSTWSNYIERLKNMLGKQPDPWNPRDAFIASATFLADLGAAKRGYSAEHEAAARYYAGGNWQTLGQGYASSVLNHAQTIQTTMIDPIERASQN